eukprot:scpid20705/ scgid17553/ 
MATSLGRAPQPFRLADDSGDSSNISAEFQIWLEDFEAYLALQKVTEASTKAQLLTNLAGLGVRRIVKGLSLPTPSGSDTEYTVLRQGLKSYFRPAVNTTVERHKFRMRKQQPAESLTAFAAGLRTAAEACEFDSTTNDSIVDSQIRDQFIAGLANIEIRRELLADPNLTLATAIRKGVSMELSYSESKLYDQP